MSVKTNSCKDKCDSKSDNTGGKMNFNLEPEKRVKNKIRDLALLIIHVGNKRASTLKSNFSNIKVGNSKNLLLPLTLKRESLNNNL